MAVEWRVCRPLHSPRLVPPYIPVLTLIGLSATAPQRASTILESLRTWMGKHNRAMTVVLCLVFGTFFLLPRGKSMGT
jgi:hypothetical protein